MVNGPAKGSAAATALSSSSLSGGKTSSSMIGPALVASTCGKVWSLGSLSLKSTVCGAGVSTLSRLASSDCGPLGSLILFSLSKENLTSDEVSECPLANLRLGLSVQVKIVGAENSQRCAMSGLSSPLPGTKFIRYG